MGCVLAHIPRGATIFHGEPTNRAENSLSRAAGRHWRVDRPEISPQHARVLDPLRQRLFHPPGFWRINVFVWVGIGGLAFLTRFIMHQDLQRAIGLTLAAETLGFFFSGLLRQYYRTLGPGRVMRPAFVFQVAALTLAAGIVQAAVVQACIHLLGWHTLRWSLWERWVLLSISMWVVYMAWSLGYFWVKAELRAHQESLEAIAARAEAQRMELQLVRFQLDPHFLFNSLNGIATEIPGNPAIAAGMVDELSSYLRYSLDHRHQLLTRLAVEMDATDAYLRIQKVRFGDRMQTTLVATKAAREAVVPSFLLQPLVENAFKHGFSAMPPPWSIEISAELNADRLTIKVRNSGPPPSLENESGLGLDAIRRRLQIHYPGRHRFHIEGTEGFVIATLDLEGAPCSV